MSRIDPIFAFLIAIGSTFAAILAWFGIKSWRDVSGSQHGKDSPQKIEVTIKEAPNKRDHSDKIVS